MKRICVFCGSRSGSDPLYAESATAVGRAIAAAGAGLVFGGGSVGLMSIVANAALEAGADVTGVIPKFLIDREHLHPKVRDMRIVDTMHERKALMAKLSDAFIALPGGFGTLEEIFEMLTWTQLRLQVKPCGFLNVNNYYSPLIGFMGHAVEHGFIAAEHVASVVIDTNPDRIVGRMLQAI